MRIKITKQIIDEAIRKDSHHCMIADAIKKAIPQAQYIIVDTQSIRYTDKDKKKRYTSFTPLTAQKNLIKFDQGEQVDEFSFNLPTPVKTRPMGWAGQRNLSKDRKGYTPKTKNKKPKKHIFAHKERAFGLRNIV